MWAILSVRIKQTGFLGDFHTVNTCVCTTAAYIFVLSHDANHDVRRAVLSCVAASTKTLPHILQKTRDVNDNVRKVAYQVGTENHHASFAN